MLQLIIVASPATYIMLLLCVLSVGFMILFLIALAIDGKKTARHPARPKEIWCPVDVINEERRSRKDAFNPASHLAMGVVRLTTALTTKPSCESKRTALAGSVSSRRLSDERFRDVLSSEPFYQLHMDSLYKSQRRAVQ
jgi:hypothetical protein